MQADVGTRIHMECDKRRHQTLCSNGVLSSKRNKFYRGMGRRLDRFPPTTVTSDGIQTLLDRKLDMSFGSDIEASVQLFEGKTLGLRNETENHDCVSFESLNSSRKSLTCANTLATPRELKQ